MPVLVGLDANGHIGQDGPWPFVGPAGAETWNSNGQELVNVALEANLSVLNTLSSYQDAGWTWRKGDKTVEHRLDYILKSRNHGVCQQNKGVQEFQGLYKEGSTVDHRPVRATFLNHPQVLRQPRSKSHLTPIRYDRNSLLQAYQTKPMKSGEKKHKNANQIQTRSTLQPWQKQRVFSGSYLRPCGLPHLRPLLTLSRL